MTEIEKVFSPIIQELIIPTVKEVLEGELKRTIGKIEQENCLPLVITDSHLRDQFSLSQTMIWKLKQLSGFPKCWMGIENHYKTSEILEWYYSDDGKEFIEQQQLLKTAK